MVELCKFAISNTFLFYFNRLLSAQSCHPQIGRQAPQIFGRFGGRVLGQFLSDFLGDFMNDFSLNCVNLQFIINFSLISTDY